MRFRHHLISLALLAAVLGLAWFIGCPKDRADASSRRQHQMTFAFAMNVAVDYWAKRNVHIPCHATYSIMSAPEAKDANRFYGGEGILAVVIPEECTIVLAPILEAYRTDRRHYWISYSYTYCQTIVHEVGHLAGLGHDYGGVMKDDDVMPWGCSHPYRFLRHWNRRHILTPLQPQGH